jgi:hypothetical protein
MAFLEFLLPHEVVALEQVLVEICDEFGPAEPLGAGLQDLVRDLVGRAAARRAVGQSSPRRSGSVLDATLRLVDIPGAS